MTKPKDKLESSGGFTLTDYVAAIDHLRAAIRQQEDEFPGCEFHSCPACRALSDFAEGALNPRWVACRVALGHEPQPHEFIVWISGRWREWERETGRQRPHSDDDHDDFTAWLVTPEGDHAA